jgi:hypothetical protein
MTRNGRAVENSVVTDLSIPVTPDDIPEVLRNSASLMRLDASKLDANWNNALVGHPWRIIASELDRAANRIDRELHKYQNNS